MLHDDKGPGDGDSFKFASAASPVTMAGGAYLVVCECDSTNTQPCFDFGIGGTDTVSLALESDPTAPVIVVGPLLDQGANGITYAYDPAIDDFTYTSTATPGSVNVITGLGDYCVVVPFSIHSTPLFRPMNEHLPPLPPAPLPPIPPSRSVSQPHCDPSSHRFRGSGPLHLRVRGGQ